MNVLVHRFRPGEGEGACSAGPPIFYAGRNVLTDREIFLSDFVAFTRRFASVDVALPSDRTTDYTARWFWPMVTLNHSVFSPHRGYVWHSPHFIRIIFIIITIVSFEGGTAATISLSDWFPLFDRKQTRKTEKWSKEISVGEGGRKSDGRKYTRRLVILLFC